jgi:hypothetical protein
MYGNQMERMHSIYGRLENGRAMITPPETVLIMRDMHNRLMKLEGTNAEENKSTRGRGTSNVSKEKVSSD